MKADETKNEQFNNFRSNDITEILTQKTLIIIEVKLKTTYRFLFNELQREFNLARSQNKKCLILVGDNHHSQYSVIVEMMVVLIASVFNNQHLALELDKSRYHLTRPNKHSLHSEILKLNLLFSTQHYFIDVEKLANELGMKIHLIDEAGQETYQLYAKNRNLNIAYINDNIEKRDKAMFRELKDINTDCIALVGAIHLPGILRENQERQKEHPFHVYSLSTLNPKDPLIIKELENLKEGSFKLEDLPEIFYDVNCNTELLKEEDIKQFNLPTLIDLLRKIHEQACKNVEPVENKNAPVFFSRKITGRKRSEREEENELLLEHAGLTQKKKRKKKKEMKRSSYFSWGCHLL